MKDFLYLVPSAIRHAALLVAALVSAAGMYVYAQQPLPLADPATTGTLYYVVFPDTTQNTYDTRFNHQKFNDVVQIILHSVIDTKVTITGGTGVSRQYVLRAGVFRVVDLNAADGFPAPVATASNTPVNNVLKVESADPVTVYCYMLTGFGCEAWTPLPVWNWGLEYYASVTPGEVGADASPKDESSIALTNKAYPSAILIVAAYDSTHVTIQPNGKLENVPALQVVLNAGQVYQVECTVDTLGAHVGDISFQSDLGGSRIVADRPVGVLSGNTRGQIVQGLAGLSMNTFKNMMFEWLAPSEQYGREFAYLPTWDSRRLLGTTNEILNGKRAAEFVRVYGSASATDSGSASDGVTGVVRKFAVNFRPDSGTGGYLLDDRVSVPLGRRYTTLKPAQCAMFSPGVSKNNGTTGGGSFIGAAYDAWGGYQALMVPREQWGTFAPYYAPTSPSAMEHFINVVADTASRFKVFQESGSLFIFNRGVIPGTDLVWGTMTVTPGVDHFLEGRNGARFFAFAYGIYKGYELFRPGRAGRDPGAGTQALHPSEYEENLGMGYGYPLAFRHTILNPQPCDSLRIDSAGSCTCRVYTVYGSGSPAQLLRNIHLEKPVNARLNVQSTSLSAGGRLADFTVCAAAETADARATIVITDHSGCVTRLEYSYTAEKLKLHSAPLAGPMRITSSIGIYTDTLLRFVNTTGKPVVVDTLGLLANTVFKIVSVTALPATLAADSVLEVRLRFTPPQNRIYYDTLRLRLACIPVSVPLYGQPAKPCIIVRDLDFGAVPVNGLRMGGVQICNEILPGDIVFVPPYITLPAPFAISQSEVDKLKNLVLHPGECVTVNITVQAAQDTGVVQGIVRLYSTALCGRDTAVASGLVRSSGVSLDPALLSQISIAPNPSDVRVILTFTAIQATGFSATLYDNSGRQALTLHDPRRLSGARDMAVPTSGLPQGLYRLMLVDEHGAVAGSISLEVVR